MRSDSLRRGRGTRLAAWLSGLFGLVGAALGLLAGVGLSYACQGPPPPLDMPGAKTAREAWFVYLAVPGLVGAFVGACAGGAFGAALGRRIDRRHAAQPPR